MLTASAASRNGLFLTRISNARRPIVSQILRVLAPTKASLPNSRFTCRWSTTSAAEPASAAKSTARISWGNIFSWRNIAIATLRYGRIVALIGGVYGLGYQRGIIEYASDPDHKEKEMLRTVILSAGGGEGGGRGGRGGRGGGGGGGEGESKDASRPDVITIARSVSENAPVFGLGGHEDLKRVLRTGRRIVQTSRKLVADKVDEHAAQVSRVSTSVATTFAQKNDKGEKHGEGGEKPHGLAGVAAVVSEMEEYQFWCQAYKRIYGHLPPNAAEEEQPKSPTGFKWFDRPEPRLQSSLTSKRPKKWTYVLIHSSVPNAFVSELLPHYVFVTTAMLDTYVDNDDELGLILGHELSHLVLGHTGRRTISEAVLRTMEVLLLSIDPTWGVATLGILSFLGLIRSSVEAANSRRDEREADELGIKIAAMACYDTTAGANVFWKMMQSPHQETSLASRFWRRPNQTTEDKTDDAKTQDEEGSGVRTSRHFLSFLESHPPTSERYDYLLELAKEENAEKYIKTDCGTMKQAFLRAWRGTSSKSTRARES